MRFSLLPGSKSQTKRGQIRRVRQTSQCRMEKGHSAGVWEMCLQEVCGSPEWDTSSLVESSVRSKLGTFSRELSRETKGVSIWQGQNY